jgi:hypothetical protein
VIKGGQKETKETKKIKETVINAKNYRKPRSGVASFGRTEGPGVAEGLEPWNVGSLRKRRN